MESRQYAHVECCPKETIGIVSLGKPTSQNAGTPSAQWCQPQSSSNVRNTSTSTPSFSTLPKHYLFILPKAISLDEQHEVVQAASKLAEEGYVYLASAHVKSMEDRDNIHFMPLHRDRMPCFGEVSGVLVARDQELAQSAKEVYRGASFRRERH